MIETADVGDDRLIILPQKKTVSERLLVRIFAFYRRYAVSVGDKPVDFRVPDIVIDPVEYSPEFAAVDVKRMSQAVRQVCMPYLPGIPGRNGRDEIGIYDAALHEVERGVVEIVPEPVVVKIVFGPVQSDLSQYELSRHTLMSEIVKGVANAGVGHPQVLVHIEEEHRNETRLPVVTVDDIRVPARLQHEFESRPAEKGEPLRVVPVTIVYAPVEEVVVRMRVDEKALSAMDKAEENGAVDPLVVERDMEIAVHLLEPVDLVVTHAVVFRQNDLHGVSSQLELMAQPVDDIAEAANLGSRGAFRCDHDDVHYQVLFMGPGNSDSCPGISRQPKNNDIVSRFQGLRHRGDPANSAADYEGKWR